MVRRSSLIIAASLAVLSTYEPTSFCFAAAAPAAQGVEDRFERPRFLKKEIKRYVFTNSSMTTSASSKEDPQTTPITLPDTTLPPDLIAASLSSVSLASAEASWSAAHPGIPFGADLDGLTTKASTPSTTFVPATTTQSPPTNKNTDDQSNPTGPQGGNGDGSKPPSQSIPSLSIPVESDSSHTMSTPASTAQSTGDQNPAGQSDGGHSNTGPSSSSGKGAVGGVIPPLSIPVESDSSHTMSVPTGAQSNPLGSPSAATTGNADTDAHPGSTAASQPAQTAEPASGSAAITPGSTPTNTPESGILPPASHSISLIEALSSALAISPTLPVNPASVGSTTNSAGILVPITAATPSSGAIPPLLIGSATDLAGKVVGSLSAFVPTGSAILASPASTDANGAPITGSAPAQTGSVPPVVGSESVPAASGSVPVVVGSGSNSAVTPGSTPPSETTGAAVLAGSLSNSGSAIPASTIPPGATTNAQGQVVSASSASGPSSDDRFAPAAIQQSTGLTAASTAPTGVVGSVPTNTPSVAGQTAASAPPASTAPEGPASSAAAPLPIATAPQSYNTAQSAPLTQLPTASDSMTAQPVASSIELASSASPTAATGSSETGLPTGVPLVLYPPTGPVSRPANAELIQIGFLYPLNYDFVWQHEESQRQIFHYLPIGIAYGLSTDLSNITMQTLRAWDTTQDLHYITTLALAWVPSTMVDSLGLILHTQAEKFYHNPDPAVRTLLSMINPALPIRADNATDGGSENAVGASPSGNPSANGGTIANGINNSSPVKASSVGIGVGVVCGAAAYGAAMFFVARRYKKRRQSHLRSPSMYTGSPVMSHHGADPAAAAALMSGGMGERSISPYYDHERGPSRGSGRSGSSAGRQQISAPVMAENSLGWN